MSCLDPSSFPSSATTSLALSIPTHSSPEPASVDTFVSDLLQAVTGDDSSICSSCEEGTSASSRCRDCSEMLCDPCVRAHQRVRVTKDHRIVKFSKEVPKTRTTANSLSSSSQVSSNSSCNSNLGTTNFCDVHHAPYRLYCETCLVAACTDCILQDHPGHNLQYIQEAAEAAKATTTKLNTDTRAAISTIREAIETVQRMSEAVEIRTRQAATDVRNVIRKYVAALEDRERDLLSHIEHVRQMKGKALHKQMENLRIVLARLTRTSDILNESLESVNSIDIIMARETAISELKQICLMGSDLIPCQDDSIAFVPPDVALLRANSALGSLNLNSTTVVLTSTRVRETAMFPHLPPMELKVEQETQLGGLPRGRPIHGYPRPIVVRDTRGNVPSFFGSEGEAEGQLCRPWGLCCDRSGNIIIADRSNNRVQVFRPDGVFSHKFGNSGAGPGQFNRPAGVAIDPLGRIVVADKDNHRIQIFTMGGSFVLMFGEKGNRHGQFNYPWDVAVNGQGHIVVSDTRNHRIQVFTNDGVFIRKYGFEGTQGLWKHFDSPRGVCFTPTGSVLVTDFNNHRIVIIDQWFKQAQFLGSEGSGIKQFMRPQGIICDDEGHIIVADSRNNRIQVFESNGTFLWKIGHQGKALGELDRPSGICISPEGRIMVVDFGNTRVQIF